MRRTGNAWAVVDTKRNDAISSCDLEDTRKRARWLRDARNRIMYPIHEGAKWKVVRVMIYEVAL